MPIYEYICPNCNSKFELLRSLSQANESASCPLCQNNAKRVFSCFSAFSEGHEGVSTAIAGSSSCNTCSAASCATCGR
ncbi:MAG: zinc ribbon domain-containing protein [Chloroflexi bacterium CG08_land_8_20_14_0_20_45_12]|nr:MAG: zinc ribbon domain-containing protein [Chloroflexi bacterium CG08_land_8_20_14_0_20_45_12]